MYFVCLESSRCEYFNEKLMLEFYGESYDIFATNHPMYKIMFDGLKIYFRTNFNVMSRTIQKSKNHVLYTLGKHCMYKFK